MERQQLRVLELYCGIGGCAAALADRAEVAAAYDINTRAVDVYRRNFPHPAHTRTLESLDARQLARWEADLWWLSPPCQPYTRRGRQRDLADSRTQSLLALLDLIAQLRPRYLALENVPPFAASQSHRKLVDVLRTSGYAYQEHTLCPTELGIAGRRRRYYLVASRAPGVLGPVQPQTTLDRPLAKIVERSGIPQLAVPRSIVEQYGAAMHILDANERGAVAQCFTSAYGRSPVRSGSYLRTDEGIRYFSPCEILRLLGFPADFALPATASPAQLWPLVGNSLAVDVVRHVLAAIPELSDLREHLAAPHLV